MSVTVTLETVTMVKETTEKCFVVILHLLSINNLPIKLLKLQVKKKIIFFITSTASSPSYLEDEIMCVLLYMLQVKLKGKTTEHAALLQLPWIRSLVLFC